MNDKVLDLVQKFIALSTSPEEEEARTSALLACKLIHKHGLVVGHPATFKAAKPAPPPPRPAWSKPPKPAPPKYPRPRTIELVSKAQCKTCKRLMFRGERAWYRPHVGVAHYTCSYDSLY